MKCEDLDWLNPDARKSHLTQCEECRELAPAIDAIGLTGYARVPSYADASALLARAAARRRIMSFENDSAPARWSSGANAAALAISSIALGWLFYGLLNEIVLPDTSESVGEIAHALVPVTTAALATITAITFAGISELTSRLRR